MCVSVYLCVCVYVCVYTTTQGKTDNTTNPQHKQHKHAYSHSQLRAVNYQSTIHTTEVAMQTPRNRNVEVLSIE